MNQFLISSVVLTILEYTGLMCVACTFPPEKARSFDTGKVVLLFIARMDLKKQFISSCFPFKNHTFGFVFWSQPP